jgi:hypothetical protein
VEMPVDSNVAVGKKCRRRPGTLITVVHCSKEFSSAKDLVNKVHHRSHVAFRALETVTSNLLLNTHGFPRRDTEPLGRSQHHGSELPPFEWCSCPSIHCHSSTQAPCCSEEARYRSRRSRRRSLAICLAAGCPCLRHIRLAMWDSCPMVEEVHELRGASLPV